MLSILIPTHNYVCAPLVEALRQQAETLGVAYEIIVADDGSTDAQTVEQNAVIGTWQHCTFVQQAPNIGRSAIRNLLAAKAQYPYLLFMDSDGEVVSEDFLKKYIEAVHYDVVCGGIIHSDRCPSDGQRLRWRYEKSAEPRFSAAARCQAPYAAFRTFCFMIKAEIFERTGGFDERIRRYGFEDVLFGHRLQQIGAQICHIDNPLQNGDIEPSPTYLRKIEESLRTLHDFSAEIGDESRQLRHMQRLDKWHLLQLLRPLCILLPLLRRQLLGKHPSMACLALYKVLYLLNLRTNSRV